MGGLLGKNVGLGVVVCFSGKVAGGKGSCAVDEESPCPREGKEGGQEGWGQPARAGSWG